MKCQIACASFCFPGRESMDNISFSQNRIGLAVLLGSRVAFAGFHCAALSARVKDLWRVPLPNRQAAPEGLGVNKEETCEETALDSFITVKQEQLAAPLWSSWFVMLFVPSRQRWIFSGVSEEADLTISVFIIIFWSFFHKFN